MKKILLLSVFLVVCLAFCTKAQTNSITFIVDLTPLNDPSAVAHIAGDLNSWTPTAMTSIGNNQFSITYDLTGGWSNNSFNFLSSSDWGDAEPAFIESCGGSNANSGKSGTNRWYYRGDEAGGESITYAYVWKSCTSALTSQVTTTFRLNMNNVLDTATTPGNYAGYISGDFNSYSISAMTDKGNGIYESEINIDENTSGNFFYLITNASDFSGKESIPSSGCADGSNRSYKVETSAITISSMVSTCATQRATWTGNTDSEWHTSTNWNDGTVPDKTYDVTIPNVANDPTVTGNTPAIVNGLLISSGASLSVTNESSLAIYGDVTNNGTYTYSRNLTTPLGYSIMGTPVKDATVADLQSDFFYAYNSGNDTYEAQNGTTTLVAGQGYFVARNTAGTVDFTGTPNSHYVSYGVTNGNFELVANPYNAAISAEDFLAGNKDALDGTLYFWDDGGANATTTTRGGDYVTVNMAGMITTGTVGLSDGVNGLKGTTPAADGYIGSAQGFFVKAKADGNVSFNPSMQVTDASSNAGSSYYRQENKSDYIELKLTLSGEGLYNETIIAYHELASLNHDYGLDAFKFSGNENISFHSVSSLDRKRKYAIQGLPKSVLSEKRVALGYMVNRPGEYQISLKDYKNLPNGYSISIKDNWENTIIELAENNDYSFTVAGQEENSDRFELVLSKSNILSFDSSFKNVQFKASLDQLQVEQVPEGNHHLVIYNSMGQVVHNGHILVQNHSGSTKVALSPNQLYIVRIGLLSQKIIIKE